MIKCVKALVLKDGKALLGFDQNKKLGLPGGKVNLQESLSEALKRELVEEINLKPEDYTFQHLVSFEGAALFIVHIIGSPNFTAKNDPDQEFSCLTWVPLSRLPEVEKRTYPGLFQVLLKLSNGTKFSKSLASAYTSTCFGKVEVLVDGKHFAYLDDDVVWMTMPGLAQEQAKGKKVTYKHVEGNLNEKYFEKVAKKLSLQFFEGIDVPPIKFVTYINELAKTKRYKDGRLEILINKKLDDEEIFEQVICHELVHIYCLKKFGDLDCEHSDKFLQIANRVNSIKGDGYVGPNANTTDFVDSV